MNEEPQELQVTKLWRPITMLSFVFFIFLDGWDFLGFNISQPGWALMETIMVVYVGGRTLQAVGPKMYSKKIVEGKS